MGNESKYIVVDIGGTKVRLALWNQNQLHEIHSMETPKVSADEFVAQVVGQIHAKFQKTKIAGLGVSTAGPVDVVNGSLMNPANLGNGDQSWRRFPMKAKLAQKLGVPVTLDNDGAMTAYGQFRHYEKPSCQDLVVLTLGTGLGVGAIVAGSLVRAGQNMHPELGHFILADEVNQEYPTPFANLPTLESFLSGFHFSNRVGLKLGRTANGAELIQLSQKSDETVMAMWEVYSQKMAIALSNIYLAYFPEKIVLGGGFAVVAAPFFLEKSILRFHEILESRRQSGMLLPDVVISPHHDELPLLGAGYNIQQDVEKI